LRKIRKIFYLKQIQPGPRFGRLPSKIYFFSYLIHIACDFNFAGRSSSAGLLLEGRKKGKLYISGNLAEKWTVTLLFPKTGSHQCKKLVDYC
jgi:hypothetical protein